MQESSVPFEVTSGYFSQNQLNVYSFSPCVCLCVCLQEQWGHVEEIELMNDGSGLGFGIVGGKAAGVVVRTVVPMSVADKVCVPCPHQNVDSVRCNDILQ